MQTNVSFTVFFLLTLGSLRVSLISVSFSLSKKSRHSAMADLSLHAYHSIDRSYDRNHPEYIILKKAKTHKPKIKINKNPEHIPHIIFQKIKQNPETQCIQTTRSAKTVPQLNNIPNSKQRKQRKKNHRNT